MFQQIIYEKNDRIATITLNRPDKRNALNSELVDELSKAFDLAMEENIRCVILTGSGNSFCAGADLEYIKKLSTLNSYENYLDAEKLAQLYLKIFSYPKITIAMVNGFALAGGCGLASVCDFIIASKENAKFGYTEPKIGFIPAIVMAFLVRRISGAKARELLLTGNIIDAEEAVRIGFANYSVPDDELKNFTFKLAENLATETSPESIKFIKEMLSNIYFLGLHQAVEYAKAMNSISRLTEDCQKGINAFLKKEKIKW
ncbi:MAG: enoyl-CoA hydratase/isomerase family protein [Candidatus Kryptonium sp.]|nr:enoyl-CoA hydratase/isomerase family protein [Candidatus Kryptonium sp.]MDW8109858.1 enoyl-CoA hydratase/isomerase family protein [Candidatus Kryptonium sp.]